MFCSDIAGQDPAAHGGDPAEVITAVRNWLATHTRARLPGGRKIAERYATFRAQLPAMTATAGLDAVLTFRDYTALVSEWLSLHSRI